MNHPDDFSRFYAIFFGFLFWMAESLCSWWHALFLMPRPINVVRIQPGLLNLQRVLVDCFASAVSLRVHWLFVVIPFFSSLVVGFDVFLLLSLHVLIFHGIGQVIGNQLWDALMYSMIYYVLFGYFFVRSIDCLYWKEYVKQFIVSPKPWPRCLCSKGSLALLGFSYPLRQAVMAFLPRLMFWFVELEHLAEVWEVVKCRY